MPYVWSNRCGVDHIGDENRFTKITDMKSFAVTEERGAGTDRDQKPGTAGQ